MIAHIVLFEPRADLDARSRDRILDDVRRTASAIPSIRRCEIGRRIRHGLPGYEQAMRDEYSYALVLHFDDLAGLQAYLTHPAHEAVAEHFGSAAARALAYDFEIFAARDAETAHAAGGT